MMDDIIYALVFCVALIIILVVFIEFIIATARKINIIDNQKKEGNAITKKL
jgi:hypothetical protein